ncbi:DUF4422 domain-containing protein [Spirabiliibacterium falconis]|uniref:DUF4422 domain-containing protein n=1 Tax=Spirabiliibacterium falconis TaxID=572023 RepID=UPI001AACFF56|nr:DUF4422 domain-containing protein [Spirabiliibacterium falconis]MBE2894791.1 DUF4422 domain-containing protein [Spirabiliibacterium falconis]
MENISLYTVYHKSSHILNNANIKPIQVGTGLKIPEINLRDNTGENIAEKNNSFCELTAQYWAWKNDQDSNYIGLMHYRRFFDFNTYDEREENNWGLLEVDNFTLDFCEQYGLNESTIESQVVPYDIVLPNPWDLTKAGWRNVRHNYINSAYHHERDLKETRNVIEKLYPEYIYSFDKVMRSSKVITTNMFIMKKEIFNDYSKWLFDILFQLEKQIDISSYDAQEKRVFGYLSERLLNVWLDYQLSENKKLRVNYLRRVFVKNTESKNWYSIKPETNKEIVSVVIASDNNYVPHLASLILSIIENLDDKFYLDLIILDGGISIYNHNMLQALCRNFDANIQFLDLKSEFNNLSVHMHFSKATFYRLILDRLVTDRDRVLYIDCDTIVNQDLSKLFFMDLEGKAIGAVFDYIMHHFCQAGIPSISDIGSIKSKEYLEDYVGLKNRWNKYFQAGVILFDLEKLRRLDLSDVMVKALIEKKYWFLDQDILNKYFSNNIKFISPKWNVVNCGDEIFNGLSHDQISEIEDARKDPYIIHYAGYETKPWNNPEARFNEYYFYYLRKTFWYEEVLFKFNKNNNDKAESTVFVQTITPKSFKWKLAKKVWNRLPSFMKVRLNKLKEYLKNRL